MSYSDTLVPTIVINLRQRYGTLDPVAETVSMDKALDHVGYILAMQVWRMIEPTIQGKVDLTQLIKEQYPFLRGVAITLGVEDKFMSTLGLMVHDAPKNVLL